MMDPVEALDDIVRLANRMPGVCVTPHELSEDVVTIHVRVRGGDAVDSLQYVAFTANVRVEPWIRKPDVDIDLDQVLRAKRSPMEGLELGYLQGLGIHIVWRLHKQGLMPASEANTFLAAWNAERVVD